MPRDLPELLNRDVLDKAGVPAGALKIFLDGKEFDTGRTLECHTAEGWIIAAKLDAEGWFYVDNDEIVTQRLTGVVTVELTETA